MSEEPPPPSLRLRPRKRDAAAAPVAPPAVAAGTEPVVLAASLPSAQEVSEGEPMRFRLKPKLGPELEQKAAAVRPEALAGASTAEFESAAPPVGGSPGAMEIPRLKLKPLSLGDAAGTIGAPPGIIPAFPLVQSAPPSLSPESAGSAALVGGLAPLSPAALAPLPLPRALPPPPVAVPVPYKPKPRAKRSPPLALIALAAVLLIAGGGAYFFLMRADQAGAGEAAQASPAPVPPTETVHTPAPVRVEIAPLPPPPAPLQTTLKPGTAAAPGKPVPSPAFRTWVSDVRVSGVLSGSSPRAIINGRLARPGDTVDIAEGIVFEGVDGEAKSLIFRGRNGALINKSY